MKQQLPVQKNEDLQLTIDALTSEGQGIGRVDGYAVFVPGALPGERVGVHIIKVTSGYAIGKLTEVLEPSGARVQPVCGAYPSCGGCTLQHLDYGEQLAVKRQTVVDALQRLGGIEAPAVGETRGMAVPWRYRNKGSFPFAAGGHGVAFGFFSPRSHRLVPITDCPIQDQRIVDIVRRVQEWADACHVSAYDESARRGVLRHVMARVTATGESMAVIVTASNRLPHADELLALLSDVDSVWHNINERDTNVIFGSDFRLLAGEPALSETILDLSFSVSPQSFLQVNAQQTAVLYGEAVRLIDAKPDETIVDAYCGVGTISLLLAQHAGRVIGIESVPEAIRDAKRNAADNGIQNAEFLSGNVEDVLPSLPGRIDGLVIDPPRKGCDERVLSAIVRGGASRVVYVSCNPATLARDCKFLTAHGFRLVSATPVDMFPQTAHVETVVLLSKGEIDSKKVRVEFSLEDMDMSEFQDGATYPQIKEYVLEHTGLKVSNLYISQIKRKCGLEVGKNYNLPKSEDSRQPQCPPEKEKAIREAFKYFGMI